MTPLRIGYIGNTSKPHCTESHISATLRSLGHLVINYQEGPPENPQRLDWKTLGARADWDGVDFVLWTRTWRLDPAEQFGALADLERRGIPTVGYHLDRWWGLSREHQIVDEPWFRQTVVCTADGGHDDDWKRVGVNHRWFEPAVWKEEAVALGKLNAELATPVAFVGSWQQYHQEWAYRMELVAWLRNTYGPTRRIRFFPNPGQQIRGRELNDLYASARVVIGDSCLVAPTHHYWSDRIPETLGRGGFLIHPNTPGLEESYTPGVHLATYDIGDWEQLAGLVDHYLDAPDERARIAEAGRAHVLAHHTYEHRMVRLLDMLIDEGLVVHPWKAVGQHHVVSSIDGQPDVRAVMRFRPDSTDGSVAGEVFRENTYRLSADDVRGRVVLDVGANIGAFSLWAAKAGAARVAAYEPIPAEYEALCRHVEMNAVEQVVTTQRAAVGSAATTVTLTAAHGGSHLDPEGDVTAFMVSIDEVLCSLGHVDVMKVDTEGAEYLIFDALTEWDRVDRIVMEFHNEKNLGGTPEEQGTRFGRLVTLLASHGHVEILGRPEAGGAIFWRRYI